MGLIFDKHLLFTTHWFRIIINTNFFNFSNNLREQVQLFSPGYIDEETESFSNLPRVMQFGARAPPLDCFSDNATIGLDPVWGFCWPDIIPGFRGQLAAGFVIKPRKAMKLCVGDKTY